MTHCIKVSNENGYYTINGDPDTWKHVADRADYVYQIDTLIGWGKYKFVYKVQTGPIVDIYFVTD